MVWSSLQPLSVSSLKNSVFCSTNFNFTIFTSLNNSDFCETKVRNLRWSFPAWLCGNGPQQGRTFVGGGPATFRPRAASRATSGATDPLRCDTAEVAREGHGVAGEGWANLGIWEGKMGFWWVLCVFFLFSMFRHGLGGKVECCDFCFWEERLEVTFFISLPRLRILDLLKLEDV